MNVLIVEDELIVADYLKKILEKHQVNVIGMVDSISMAKASIQKSKPDLCVVDIRLVDGDSGIDLGVYLNQENIPFIYLTANNEITTIKKAVLTKPQSYLTKPFSERDIIAAIELIKVSFSSNNFLSIKSHKGKIKISFNNILYLQADNVYTKIFTLEKEFVERITLKEIESKLDASFVKVHRSYVVNKSKITSFTASVIYINDTKIPVSRSFKDSLN